MTGDRHLDWEGCRNTRDLGGLAAAGGRFTRRGALVRSDAVEGLTAAGWAALAAYGIRTVVDLRNDDEIGMDAAPRPAGVRTLRRPLDGIEDTEFWDRWGGGPEFATPVYYGPWLERFPERAAQVLAAIAHAPAGGVLFHCAGGRDRAGLVSMLALALAGVGAEDIAADHALSAERLGREPEIEAYLEREGVTAAGIVVSTLASMDLEAHLREGGLAGGDIEALRARMLGGDRHRRSAR